MGTIWTTKEWKETISDWKEGKRGNKKDKCEECGSDEILAPHHLISFNRQISLKFRELGIKGLCKEREISNVFPSSFYGNGGIQYREGKESKYLKVNILKEYLRKHPELKEKAKILAKEEYLSLSHTRTLCRRCHYAIERGLMLCMYCEKKFHNPRFDSCSDCKEEAQKEYEEFEEEMAEMEKRMF